jgi:hypothetical protein
LGRSDAGYEVLVAMNIKEYGILGCDVVWFSKNPTFRSDISPLSSGHKIKASKKPAEIGRKLSSAGFLRAEGGRAPYTCMHID